MESSPTITALARASRRAVYHLLQAGIEGLKAIEAVIEEIGAIGNEAIMIETPADRRLRSND
jgi:hypothetical protein